MWRNTVVRSTSWNLRHDSALGLLIRGSCTQVRDLVEWLHNHNAKLEAKDRAGFYGMDLYSFISSSNEVLDYLDRVPQSHSVSLSARLGSHALIRSIRKLRIGSERTTSASFSTETIPMPTLVILPLVYLLPAKRQ